MRFGGRLVVADGFLTICRIATALQQRIYRKLCECGVIEELAPVLLPLVSSPLGPLTYCMIAATKR